NHKSVDLYRQPPKHLFYENISEWYSEVSILTTPVKSSLKVQNGVHNQLDSQVKKFSKRSRQILDSDEAPVGKEQAVKREQEDRAVLPRKEKVATTFPTTFPSLCKPSLIRRLFAHPALGLNVSLFFCVISVARKPVPKRELDSRSGSEEEVKEEQGPQKKRARVDKTQDSTGKVYFPPLQVCCFLPLVLHHSLSVENEEEAMEVGGEGKKYFSPHTYFLPSTETSYMNEFALCSLFRRKKCLNTALYTVLMSVVSPTREKTDQAQYDPSRPNYHPVDHACWGWGQRVPYSAVARTFEKIEEDWSIETLSNLLLGETVLMKAVAQLDKIKAEAAEKGDSGLVAESSRSNQRMFQPANLTAGGVFNKLKDIRNMSGNSELSAMNKKIDIIKGLYVACRFSEARNIVSEMPNYDVIIPVLVEGMYELHNHCKLTPGVPLRPMLAQPPKGVGEGMKRSDEATFTCEYKYDGERAQIHILENGEVRIFSRNQEDNMTKYPDIISRIPTVIVTLSTLAHSVCIPNENKQIQPFQVLTTRKRKDVNAVEWCVSQFLVKRPLGHRALLKESFEEGEFVFACAIDSDNTDTIAELMEYWEPLVYTHTHIYTLISTRMKTYHSSLSLCLAEGLSGWGTVDLCVIGAYLGKGKRIGTYEGFLHCLFQEHILPKPHPYHCVDLSTEPDVWLDAVQVWEVKCADLSLSPIYKAGMGLCDPEKGISLRFPRFLRIRDDKKPEHTTSGRPIADLYREQQVVQNQGDKADLEDYY
uniref:Ligase I, DNA, ATP-dependent n=1 Tax=Oncorhynchus tshawytscha TaxID=74940 RepID=A0A8C8ENF1_ONCTS